MEQYISKSALVAEIDRRMQELRPTNTHKMQVGEKMDMDVLMWLNALTWVKKVIDTLEVIKIGVDICAPEGDESTVYDTYPIMEPPHIVLANIDVAKMVKEKEKFLQQILFPFGYSEDHVEQMVTCYKQGIIDTLEKIEEP